MQFQSAHFHHLMLKQFLFAVITLLVLVICGCDNSPHGSSLFSSGAGDESENSSPIPRSGSRNGTGVNNPYHLISASLALRTDPDQQGTSGESSQPAQSDVSHLQFSYAEELKATISPERFGASFSNNQGGKARIQIVLDSQGQLTGEDFDPHNLDLSFPKLQVWQNEEPFGGFDRIYSASFYDEESKASVYAMIGMIYEHEMGGTSIPAQVVLYMATQDSRDDAFDPAFTAIPRSFELSFSALDESEQKRLAEASASVLDELKDAQSVTVQGGNSGFIESFIGPAEAVDFEKAMMNL